MDEVRCALFIALLECNVDKALFWAYELFYSGFRTELSKQLWQIYYDFYATLNPKFEKYLLSKIGSTDISDALVLANIINHLHIIPYNVDVFLLKAISKEFTLDVEELNFVDLLKTEDHLMIMGYIFSNSDVSSLLKGSLTYFNHKTPIKEMNAYNKSKNISFNKGEERSILLSRILGYLHKTKPNQTKESIDTTDVLAIDDINKYETVTTTAWLILPSVTKFSIDETEWLSLFRLKREHSDLQIAYRTNWVYFASFSPEWFFRIKKFNGFINHENQSVNFDEDDEECDDNFQGFYTKYGLDPDEQSLSTQNKTIQPILKINTWVSFNNKFNHKGITTLSDELDELVQIDY